MKEPQVLYFKYRDLEIPYLFERSSRIKRLKLTVDASQGIRIILPEKVSESVGLSFFEEQVDWVYRQWKKMAKRYAQHQELFQPFLEKNFTYYLGKRYQLIIEVGSRHWPPVAVEDDALVVYCVTADLAENILERWYRRQAKAVIVGSLEYYREQMGVKYNNLVIKDQKTRWGSCSSEGNLNFSWRLILSPKSVLDYVVVHELAHLKEMNHSERFWRVVEKVMPDYKERVRWLKENGVSLKI